MLYNLLSHFWLSLCNTAHYIPQIDDVLYHINDTPFVYNNDDRNCFVKSTFISIRGIGVLYNPTISSYRFYETIGKKGCLRFFALVF